MSCALPVESMPNLHGCAKILFRKLEKPGRSMRFILKMRKSVRWHWKRSSSFGENLRTAHKYRKSLFETALSGFQRALLAAHSLADPDFIGDHAQLRCVSFLKRTLPTGIFLTSR